MTWRVPHDGGPEPVPPRELLRMRDELVRPPRPEVRGHHVAAAAAEARAARTVPGPTHALARRGARVIAGVAGIIVVTSGLAGAQILPEPARSLTVAVSQRLSPDPPPTTEPPEAPVAEETEPETTSSKPSSEKDGGTKTATADADARSPSTTAAPTTSSTSSSTSSSSTSTSEPDDSSTTTSTTDPSTTTTEPDGSSTTTTEPDGSSTTTSSSSTTSTTEATTTTSQFPVAPAFGQDGSGSGAGGDG